MLNIDIEKICNMTDGLQLYTRFCFGHLLFKKKSHILMILILSRVLLLILVLMQILTQRAVALRRDLFLNKLNRFYVSVILKLLL